MEEKDGELKVILFIVMLFILTMPSISADFFPDFWNKITGQASSQSTNVSITVAGTSPATIPTVSAISATDPSESSLRNITFYVTMSDTDGVNDLNDSSVNASFSRVGETNRTNSSCVLVSDIDSTSANYSCTISMWYWDGNGNWNVIVTGTDLGNLSLATNTSTAFTYNLLKAMVISPNELTWPSISPAATNQTSNNDPSLINNTGNYNSTIQVTAINLLGQSDTSKIIYAANFTTALTTGGAACSGTACSECNATGTTALVNATATTITGSNANRGNISAGSGAGQEQFYYCIPNVPSSLSSQTYSTLTAGSWTVLFP